MIVKNLAQENNVHEVFQHIAQDYDKMNGVISLKMYDRWRHWTSAQMAVKFDSHILDVCCGTGKWTFDLARLTDSEVIGLDFSEDMLTIAKERAIATTVRNVKFVQGNALKLPFDSESFDFVTIGYGLRNIPDYLQTLREIYRVLKPNGQIACIDTSHPTVPVYRQLFNFYFRFIMPVLGKIFSNHYRDYLWLQVSARRFPDAEQLARLFEEAGFLDVHYKLHARGAAASHFARKKG